MTSLTVKGEGLKQRAYRATRMKTNCLNVCWWPECIEVDLEVQGELEGMEDQLTCNVTATQVSITGEFLLCTLLKHYIRHGNTTM